MLDRSAILRDAHSRARWLQHQERYRSPERRVYASYRKALASSLRDAWRHAKEQAAYAVRAAALAAEDAAAALLPADVARWVADLHLLAGVQPLNSDGAAQHRAYRAEADDIARAARCSMIPAHQGTHHVAH